MEEIQTKKTKAADEKYCSECGEIIRLKAYICPKCGVKQLPISDDIESSGAKDKKLGEKFLYSTGISFLVFLIIVLTTTPNNTWMNGFIGSCMFAVFCGGIAMAIPTTRKIIYLPISLSIMLFVAMVIGLAIA
jgi:hypothetical protein